MNSTLPPADFIRENNVESASDTNSDEDVPEYYQPISAIDADDDEEDEDPERLVNSRQSYRGLSNGYYTHGEAGNGISALELNGDVEQKSESDEEEDGERIVEAPESAIWRAFREDERRRNAPLTPENTARVVEAMRRVSFQGAAPSWAPQVPENRWIDHLRGLRQPSASGTSNSLQN